MARTQRTSEDVFALMIGGGGDRTSSYTGESEAERTARLEAERKRGNAAADRMDRGDLYIKQGTE